MSADGAGFPASGKDNCVCKFDEKGYMGMYFALFGRVLLVFVVLCYRGPFVCWACVCTGTRHTGHCKVI